MKLSASKRNVVQDAQKKGYEVCETESEITIARRHAKTRRVLQGICVFQDGTAVDATVHLTVARCLRSAGEWKSVLGL
jgi:hypothetical protein